MARLALLEDDHDSAEVIQAILEGEHEVQWFPITRDFFESFHEIKFDIILLDISLSDTNGYQVYSYIRKHDTEIPVIVISAHAQPEAIQFALTIGVREYVTKPFLDLESFREIIRRNVSRADRGAA
jgi:two-component system, NtrC family, nitrogen regulation response regulator NtrX